MMNKSSFSFLLLLLLINGPLFGQEAFIHFQIIETNSGRLTPAKAVVLKDGKNFDLKLESHLQLASRDNTVYTASGTGSFPIAPGSYEIWFGKGMEYSVDIHQVEVESGQSYYLKAHLTRELNTDGYVCGDMHLHTLTNSGHGDASLEERVISCAAEGLEWAVATDHNFVTDYQPILESLGLKGLMATTVSNEVSTQIGHFNTYPLESGSPPSDASFTNGHELFQNIRANAPEGVVIQINHPRWIDSDYFNTKGLDPHFGTVKSLEWSWDFDAFEVLNENYKLGWIPAPDNKFSVKKDWFNLLNHNRRITGLGNSDSHSVVSAIAGLPRNYIVSSTDTPSEIDESELAENIKAQQLSVAHGIFVTMMGNNFTKMGGTIKSYGHPVELNLHVEAASWISCNRAELIRNGVVVKTFNIPPSTQAVRLDTTIIVRPQKDSWYLLIAYGDKSMAPMTPVRGETNTPMGFTNPIWIDPVNEETFTSVADYAKEKILKVANQSDEALIAFRQEPEIIPYAFQTLFESKHKNVVAITKAFLEKATIDEKMMLYRELSKRDDQKAADLLEKQLAEAATPYEEVSLAWYVNFPLNKSRFSNFKQKQEEAFGDKLSDLETTFRFIHSGAVKHPLRVSRQGTPGWEEHSLSQDGFLYLNTIKAASAEKVVIQQEWFTRKDTTMEAYLNANESVEIQVNGQSQKTWSPEGKKDFSHKLVNIPVQKGINTINLKLENKPNAKISFVNLESDLLVDPNLKIKEIKHLAQDKPIQYLTEYAPRYHGFGTALTDGYRGTSNFSDQFWQGWQGQDLEVVIDLEEKEKVNKISLGLLANQGSWIFLPKEVLFLVSDDGKDFREVYQTPIDALTQTDGTVIQDVSQTFKKLKARYIKVIAKKIDQLPDWHNAAGNTGSWIFADEVIVE